MGPHPGRRPIITLKGAIKTSVAPSSPPPVEKPVDGAQTAASIVRVGEDPAARDVGPAALKGLSAAVWAARKRKRAQALIWLATEYPATLGADVKPLALGAGKLIWPAARIAGHGRIAFNAAMKFRTTSARYLAALAADGAQRHDLAGNAIEPVSDEHRENAKRALAAIRAQISSAASSHERGPRPPRTPNPGGD